MRRPPRHLVLILLTSVTLAVLGCVSPFRRSALGIGGEGRTRAEVVGFRKQQEEEKEDGHDGKEPPVSEKMQDAREPTAPAPGADAWMGAGINYIITPQGSSRAGVAPQVFWLAMPEPPLQSQRKPSRNQRVSTTAVVCPVLPTSRRKRSLSARTRGAEVCK